MDFLYDILMQDKPSIYIRNNCDEIFEIIPELSYSKGFNQNNIWHVYDVFEHILHVIDGVDKDIELRLAAFFHDIGKPFVYKEDENGIGHFFGHWDKSNEIFLKYADKYNLDDKTKRIVSTLIINHDRNIDKLSDEELDNLIRVFDRDGIIKLFKLKRSDLLSQNKEFHYLLDNYNKQEIRVLSRKFENNK